MIIDFHTHLNSERLVAKGYWDAWVKLSSVLSGRSEDRLRQRLPEFWDESGELLLSDMNNAGIDISVISVLDYGLAKGIGEAAYSILEINQLYADVAKRNPGRIIAFAGVDPRRKNALEIVRTCLDDFQMAGLKLLNPTGFYPNDPICYPIYELAAERNVPVLIHTGPEVHPMYSKYGYPIFADEVATDFPELKIVLGHAGFCWWPEAVSIANNKPNVYLDIAGWQPRARRMAVEEFYKPLRIMLDNVGTSRIIFGTDWPALRLLMNSKKSVDLLLNPTEDAVAAGMAPTEAEAKAVLGDNAAKLLMIGALA